MKKLLALLLSTTLIVVLFSGCNNNGNTAVSKLNDGECFYMGSYPQTLIKDSSLCSQLDSVNCEMNEYLYSENMNLNNLYSDTVDYYCGDLDYNGERYRKIEINKYRNGNFSDAYAQADNSYTEGSIYYFKWEPIKWIVAYKNGNGIVAVANVILDCEPYSIGEDDYDLTWENSHIRGWLNDAFYNNAFNSYEKQHIVTINNNNNDGDYYYANNGNNTNDKIYLLSYNELNSLASALWTTAPHYELNDYSDKFIKQVTGSDYAKSRGLFVNNHEYKYGDYYPNGYSWWLLRTISDTNTSTDYYYGKAKGRYYICSGDIYGTATIGYTSTYSKQSDCGIRPTMTVENNTKVTTLN